MAAEAPSHRSRTPFAASAAPIRGRRAPATSAWTRSCSAALHTPGRWVLALTTIDSAIAGSAALSMYTKQTPSKCLMTGIVLFSATNRIRPSPPRGMTQWM